MSESTNPIDSTEALFKAAPRKTSSIKVGNGEIGVIELSVSDRFAFQKFAKQHPDDQELCFAWLMTRCCPLLRGTSVTELREKLDPTVITAGGLAALSLSGLLDDDKKKPKGSAQSDDSSTASH